jgi:hypothetical protein
MKPTKLNIQIFFGFLFITISTLKISAQQTPVKPSIDKGSFESRFDYIIREATPMDDSKIVKAWWLYRLKTAVSDTIKVLNAEIAQNKIILTSKSAEIDSLKISLQSSGEQLNKVNDEKNNIRFIGIPMSKISYNSLMWTIIFSLSAVLIIIILLYKRSHLITAQTKTDLKELKEEFEAFRKRALEREEKIVRNYHDELNKYKSKG